MFRAAGIGGQVNLDAESSDLDGSHRSVSVFVLNRSSLCESLEPKVLFVPRSVERAVERSIFASFETK